MTVGEKQHKSSVKLGIPQKRLIVLLNCYVILRFFQDALNCRSLAIGAPAIYVYNESKEKVLANLMS